MKLCKKKFDLVRARTCKGQRELRTEGVSNGTMYRAIHGEELRPKTMGIIAKALGVDVTEIIEEEGYD